MNKRMEQLYLEAFQAFDKRDEKYLEVMEKFAKEIIKDCIQEMTLWERIDLAIRGIKERFGVE